MEIASIIVTLQTTHEYEITVSLTSSFRGHFIAFIKGFTLLLTRSGLMGLTDYCTLYSMIALFVHLQPYYRWQL